MIIEIVFFPISTKNNTLLDAYNSLFYSAVFTASHSTKLYTIMSPDTVQYWFIEPQHYCSEIFELNECVKYISHLRKYDHFTYNDVLHKKNIIVDLIAAQPYTFR